VVDSTEVCIFTSDSVIVSYAPSALCLLDISASASVRNTTAQA
jgi:hypothetical protein